MRKRTIALEAESRQGYIPAPYQLDEGDRINGQYLEPVRFHNPGGHDISVTTCGVIVKDGLYFKDFDNTRELTPYKDWRLPAEERARDLVSRLPLIQQAGLIMNTLWNSPLVNSLQDALDGNGSPVPDRIFKAYDPAESAPPEIIPGVAMRVDSSDVTERRVTAGVYRSDMRADASLVALYHNIGTQMLEYESCQGGIALPYSLHTNPINIGYPDPLGMGAAVMGDGNFELIRSMAETDRKMMAAAGEYIMYGPQVDIATDPRWPRISGTYGERPDVTSGIIRELVTGYHGGTDGLKKDSIALTVKHFPGDGPSENGFEPHVPIGQWRVYRTPGSMERYHLPPFQAAFDAGASAIMPDYSRVAADGRSVPQYYRGHLTSQEEVPSTYSKGLITDLARDVMGFTGYVNSDSGVTASQVYGVEGLSMPERFAKIISAGTDVIGGNPDVQYIVEAVEQGILPKEDLDRANYRRLLSIFRAERFDDPYLDPVHADAVRRENLQKAKDAAMQANRKAVVLAKNHLDALPMQQGKKLYIECFQGVDSMAALAQSIGAGVAGDPDATRKQLAELFSSMGMVLVDTPEEADYALLHVWPVSNGVVFNQFAMPSIEMVENGLVEERERNRSQKKTGRLVPVTTLKNVDHIPDVAARVHAHGGKVIAILVVQNPWILDKLEPYVDAMTIQYTVSHVAMSYALTAQAEALLGQFNPTGQLSLTMVSGPDVIAIHEEEIDGVLREICASPNDVPGYDKDQYIDPAILKKVPGGSYAYQDADGNYYRSGFGLTYAPAREGTH